MSKQPRSIIKLEPIDNFFRINWRFDIRCNYDCCYCDSGWHSTSSPVKTLENLKESWKAIYRLASQRNRPLQVSFLGGEPTANRNFVPLIEWIYENYGAKIALAGLSTNGSAPTRIYQQLIQLIDFISFSTHSEFWDEAKFFRTVIETKQSVSNSAKQINVTLMNEPWNSHRLDHYKNILQSHEIPYKVIDINWNHATRMIPIINQTSKEYHVPQAR